MTTDLFAEPEPIKPPVLIVEAKQAFEWWEGDIQKVGFKDAMLRYGTRNCYVGFFVIGFARASDPSSAASDLHWATSPPQAQYARMSRLEVTLHGLCGLLARRRWRRLQVPRTLKEAGASIEIPGEEK